MSSPALKSIKELESKINQCRRHSRTASNREKILLCTGGGCIASGALKIKEALENALKNADLLDRYVIVETGCLGPCAGGPVMVIEKDKTFYQKVGSLDCSEIVSSHLLRGEVVKRCLWKDETGEIPIPVMTDIGFFHRQTKIVLRNCGAIDPLSIESYLSVNGYGALAKVLSSMTPQQVIEEIKTSGLRGRGGAGFPTWMKWNFARDAAVEMKYILCNGDEGDPGAFMDRSVLEGDPHSLIEGMAIGAFAIGASQGYVYVRAEYPLAVERLQKAIKAARDFGLLGDNILGSGFTFNLEIRMGSGAFVCGEETALISSIEGKRGEPRPRPPFPARSGLWGKPTVLNNVETFANIAAIIDKGGEWFASFGTEKSRGTKVFALAGAIVNSGLVEVPIGTTLGELIYDIGGGCLNGKRFKAAQIGGPSGGCIPRRHLNVTLDYESLSELGAIMGSGGLIVMDEDSCMVDVARFFLEFVQEESCGKCVPCRVGTKRMLEILERICRGEGVEGDVEKLVELGNQIKDTALCGLGQTAPNPVLSTIRHFRHEYDNHIRRKECEAGVCAALVRAPCQSGCPAHVDVPGFVSLVGEKRYAEALRLHRERNPFAAVCARVCFHTCEEKCRRATIDASVSVRGIKRFMVDQEITIQLPEVRESAANAQRKIAIVGAGPAGLSCAYFLARMGYKPTVFESEPRPGGMLVQTIPAYRLPRETIAREIRMIERMGVQIITRKKLGVDFTIASLRDDGYEALFLGMGNPDGIRPTIAGSEAQGVDEAVEFLREYNLRGSVGCGRKVVVVGGGNAAIDAARTARRLEAEATVVYRRTREQMPAYAEEIDEAIQEGVVIKTLVNPIEIVVADNRVSGVRCVEMKLGDFDSSGRRRAEKSTDSFVIEADQVIFAIGQSVDCASLCSDLSLDTIDNSRIRTDDVTGRTSVPWIFAGGDVSSGPSSVIEAIAGGERAAVGIDIMFTGEEHAFWRTERKVDTSYDPEADPVPYKREKLPLLSVERRQNNFDEVEMPWVEAEALRQAKRCLRCDYGKC